MRSLSDLSSVSDAGAALRWSLCGGGARLNGRVLYPEARVSPVELSEIKRLLAEYRAYVARRHPPPIRPARARLETLLVRHADALIAAAEAQAAEQTNLAA